MNEIYLVTAGDKANHHLVSAFTQEKVAIRIAEQECGKVEKLLLDNVEWKKQFSNLEDDDLGWHVIFTFCKKKNKENFYIWRSPISNCLEHDMMVHHYRSLNFNALSISLIAKNEEIATEIAIEKFNNFLRDF